MGHDTIVQLHTYSGIAVFVFGLIQFIAPKGGKLHIWLGRLYVWLWLLLIVSGAILGSPVITTIGVFGYYFTLTGARLAHLKQNPSSYLTDSCSSPGRPLPSQCWY